MQLLVGRCCPEPGSVALPLTAAAVRAEASALLEDAALQPLEDSELLHSK
jgi:hypothetical protein